MMGGPRTWTVYRLEFPDDGAQYVGITSLQLEERLGTHANTQARAGNGNQELRARLRAGDKHYVHRVASGLTEDEARMREAGAIRLLERPINITHATAPQMRRYTGEAPENPIDWGAGRKKWPRCPEPRPGCYRCSVCREVKPHWEYQRDKHRFNGLDSRCRECRSARTPRNPVRPGRYTCPQCGTEKPHTEFYRRPNRINGISQYCHDCAGPRRREAAREYYAQKKRNPNPIIPGTYRCRCCRAEKAHTEFSPDPRGSAGILGQCKACAAADSRARHARRRTLFRHHGGAAAPCKICGEAPRTYHDTICNYCNRRVHKLGRHLRERGEERPYKTAREVLMEEAENDRQQ